MTALTDSNSSVANTYTYDAYGNILSSSGSVTNPYRFSTKEYSSTSGLIYFGARYYDPRVGRWITPDIVTWGPDDLRIFTNRWTLSDIIRYKLFLIDLGFLDPAVPNDIRKYLILELGATNPERFHRYAYCLNDPVNLVDPWGLAPSFWKRWLREFLKRLPGSVGPPIHQPTYEEAKKCREDLNKIIDKVKKRRRLIDDPKHAPIP